jgi:predicted enzyme related to lactoylglutathione lyase
MSARITAVAIDARDPHRLAAFWAEVLGWEVADSEPDGYVSLRAPGHPEKGPVPALDFLPTPDPTPGKVRLHLDVNATDRDQDAELARLLALGATHVDVGQGPRTDEMTWYVLADPEGNEFCLLAATVSPLGAP